MKRILDEHDIKSLEEWLDGWGDGANWVDSTGNMIPITKATLRNLLATIKHYQFWAAVNDAYKEAQDAIAKSRAHDGGDE